MIKKLTKFISDIVRKDKGESAKRIIALLISTTLIVLLSIYTSEDNIISITWALAGFISALLGVAAWEDIAKMKVDKEPKENQ